MMAKAISKIIETNPQLEIAGVCNSGEEALKKIPRLTPDVITLDLDMPDMDGVTTLKHIMVQYSTPVIMVSSFTYDGSLATFDGLFLGAVDFVWKNNRSSLHSVLPHKIIMASQIKLKKTRRIRTTKLVSLCPTSANKPYAKNIILMEGGESSYGAYFKIIPLLPKNSRFAVIIIQEMHPDLLERFSNYLQLHSYLCIENIREGEALRESVCYIAPHSCNFQITSSEDNKYYYFTNSNHQESTICTFHNMSSSMKNIGLGKKIAVCLSNKKGCILPAVEEFQKYGEIIVQDPGNCMEPQVPRAILDKKYAVHMAIDADISALLLSLTGG